MLACTLRGLSVFGGSTYACKSCLLTWQSVDRRGWVSSRPDWVRTSLKATSKWVEMMQHHELHTGRLNGERHMTRATPISGPLPQCTAADMTATGEYICVRDMSFNFMQTPVLWRCLQMRPVNTDCCNFPILARQIIAFATILERNTC